MSSPLQSVLTAFGNGATSRADLVRATGLRAELVDAAIEHLVRIGRLEAKELAMGCPAGGCRSCASGDEQAPGCGANGPSSRRAGRVFVQLTLPHQRAEGN